MNKILISACLLGEHVRYDGRHSLLHSAIVQQWQQQERVLALCPEVAGGLPVPRPVAELDDGDAEAVLRGQASIRHQDGRDVSDAFIQGAEQALAACLQHQIRMAVLKEGSPSCGVNRVNDGSFSAVKIPGQGVTAALLRRHGIAVFSEQQVDQAAAYLADLEVQHG